MAESLHYLSTLLQAVGRVGIEQTVLDKHTEYDYIWDKVLYCDLLYKELTLEMQT